MASQLTDYSAAKKQNAWQTKEDSDYRAESYNLEYDRAMNSPSREEVDAKIMASQAISRAELSALKQSIEVGFADIKTSNALIRSEINSTASEMRVGDANLRADFANNRHEMFKWTITLLLTVIFSGIGVVFTTLNFLKQTPQTQVTSQTAPSSPVNININPESTQQAVQSKRNKP
ncbi:MAG: hypothetical protein RJB18_1161 [Pseudomonadota bacterium]|jgi:hypothetical protein